MGPGVLTSPDRVDGGHQRLELDFECGLVSSTADSLMHPPVKHD